MVNLDTHILIDLVRGMLKESERPGGLSADLAISGIVLWEIAKLVELGRLAIEMEDPRFISVVEQLQVILIDLVIAQTSCRFDFRSDPDDEIIAATSVVMIYPC